VFHAQLEVRVAQHLDFYANKNGLIPVHFCLFESGPHLLDDFLLLLNSGIHVIHQMRLFA
jgi:hypothetical protein